jgi:hypothetical protein
MGLGEVARTLPVDQRGPEVFCMSDASWHYPGADPGGFVAFEALQERARQIDQEQFAEEFPVPALLVIYREPDSSKSGVLDPASQGVQLLTVSIKSAAILRYLNRLAFVCKRPGNPFAHLISIGRSASNDISIGVDSVSKVHGYFAHDEAGWHFTDHSSTNGSLINDKPLESGEKQILKEGDLLQLGLEVTLEYYNAPRLYLKAKG